MWVFAVILWVFGIFGSLLGYCFAVFALSESGGKYPFIILKGETEGSPRPRLCPLHSHPTTTQHPHRPQQSSIPLPRIPCPANHLSRILCKASWTASSSPSSSLCVFCFSPFCKPTEETFPRLVAISNFDFPPKSRSWPRLHA